MQISRMFELTDAARDEVDGIVETRDECPSKNGIEFGWTSTPRPECSGQGGLPPPRRATR